MADFIRAMLYHCLVPGRALFASTIPILVKTTAQTVAAKSSIIVQSILTSNHHSIALKTWKRLPPSLHNCCQQRNVNFQVLIYTAIFLLSIFCIRRMISRSINQLINPSTARLHYLERAITRQIEINRHLSRPSQNRQLQTPNCNINDFEQWAVHWADIKRFREQAEADFLYGVPIWYYDDDPDCKKRELELNKELARLHTLGGNIVNAREAAKRYCGRTAGRERAVDGDAGEGWLRRKGEAFEAFRPNQDAKGKSGYDGRRASQGKAISQQQVDAVGRLTPGGRLG